MLDEYWPNTSFMLAESWPSANLGAGRAVVEPWPSIIIVLAEYGPVVPEYRPSIGLAFAWYWACGHFGGGLPEYRPSIGLVLAYSWPRIGPAALSLQWPHIGQVLELVAQAPRRACVRG